MAGDLGVQIVVVLVALVVVSSALAIGTVHVQTLVVIAPIAFAAAALGLWHDFKRRGGTSIALPAVIATILAFITLIQAIPLPISWLERIAPANADIWA